MVISSAYRVRTAHKFIKGVTFYFDNVGGLVKNYSKLTSQQKEKWDLLSAVSLERKPIIARELNEIEKKMQKLLDKVELEKSSKSDHEIQLITDKIKLEQLKKGDNKLDLDSIPERSAQDFEDASLKELSAFKFAATTNPDENNNTKSTDRHLDRNLLLLIKEKVGNNSIWVLPQGKRQEGETLRQTAERILEEKCGSELNVEFFGNAPVGFYKYKYPKQIREQNSDSAVGAKIFFYKAQFRGGNIKFNSDILSDYQWATRKELSVLHNDYYKSIAMFLIDEDH